MNRLSVLVHRLCLMWFSVLSAVEFEVIEEEGRKKKEKKKEQSLKTYQLERCIDTFKKKKLGGQIKAASF